MPDLKTLRLGNEGMAFVVSQLGAAGTFARCVLERVPLAEGEVVTRLPEHVPLDEAKQLATGGKLPAPPAREWRSAPGATLVPVPSTRDDLARIIADHLATPGSLCLLANANAERGDPWLERTGVPTFYFDREVYHLLTASPPGEIEAALKAAQSLFLFVGALTALPMESDLPAGGGDLPLATLEQLAANTSRLFVGAYDGEGYLIWRRK